jgi:hypothetical protein
MWVPLLDLVNMTPFQMKGAEPVVYLTVMSPSHFKLFKKDSYYTINKDQKISVYCFLYNIDCILPDFLCLYCVSEQCEVG